MIHIFKALLCDFDGVIGNTADDTWGAWSRAFAIYDIKISQEEYFLEEGRSSEEILRAFLKKENRNEFIIPAILAEKDKILLAKTKANIFPGTKELFQWAKSAGIKVGVVSGGSKKRLSKPEIQSEISAADILVTADDVSIRKPSPEPYLKAASLLNVHPNECLVIENAPLGIESAKRAGMPCIAITSTLPKKYLSNADIVVDNLLSALEVVKEWSNKK